MLDQSVMASVIAEDRLEASSVSVNTMVVNDRVDELSFTEDDDYFGELSEIINGTNTEDAVVDVEVPLRHD